MRINHESISGRARVVPVELGQYVGSRQATPGCSEAMKIDFDGIQAFVLIARGWRVRQGCGTPSPYADSSNSANPEARELYRCPPHRSDDAVSSTYRGRP